MRAFACQILALIVLIAPTVADAQQQKQQQRNSKNLSSEEVLEARRACFEEAKIRAPGPAEASAGLASLRENAYRDCAARKGVRP
jgi:hypothetical protein